MNQQKNNGLGETRTPDLRRVNSPFEDLKGLFGESNSFNSSFSCPLLSVPQDCSKTNNAGLVDLELPFTKKELQSLEKQVVCFYFSTFHKEGKEFLTIQTILLQGHRGESHVVLFQPAIL